MTTLKTIEEKQHRFIRGRDKLRALLKEFKPKPEGKTVGLKIPEPIRNRLMRQSCIWKTASYRQLIHTCIMLGLEQVEELGKIQKRALEAPPISTIPPARPKNTEARQGIDKLMEDIRYGDQGFMEKVSEVPRSSDQGDGGVPSPDGDEEDVSR